MKSHLAQIAKTAVLCMALGLAMFYALEWLASSASRERVALWLALALSLALALVTIPSALDGWRSGVLPGKTGSVERRKEPGWYWSLLCLEAAAGAGLFALAAYCAMRLLSH